MLLQTSILINLEDSRRRGVIARIVFETDNLNIHCQVIIGGIWCVFLQWHCYLFVIGFGKLCLKLATLLIRVIFNLFC